MASKRKVIGAHLFGINLKEVEYYSTEDGLQAVWAVHKNKASNADNDRDQMSTLKPNVAMNKPQLYSITFQ